MFTRYTFLFLFAGITAFAQQSRIIQLPLGGVATESTMRDDFAPNLQCLEMPKQSDTRLQQIKDSLALRYPKTHSSQVQRDQRMVIPPAPSIGRNIQGNTFGNSTPTDNEIAVSNAGKIISVQNSNIFRYDDATGTALIPASLAAWANVLSNPQSKFDPKVIYDPEQDRYIMLCLAGFTDSTSSIILGFSQTNSPTGAWNLYELPGDALNNGLWTDYPMVSMTHQEVFITVNLLYNNMPWQTGFAETIIWQINKNSGYTGSTLQSQLHSGIQHNGRNVRNLCPVKGGSQLYGPDMYFVSNRNLDASNDTIFLVHLTDTINAPGQQVTVQPLVSNIKYFAPADAEQSGTANMLATNDARILGALIENNKIQFVQNTMDTANGRAAIMHGIITNPGTSPAVTAFMYTDTVEFGYPNIGYCGNGPSDDRVIIGMLHTSSTVFPGVSAMVYDGTGYSPRVVTKAGTGYVNLLTGNLERWGDYTGMQRSYNGAGTVWINGYYGNTSHTHSTWITELAPTSDVGIAAPPAQQVEVQVFPNPTVELVEILFDAPAQEQYEFNLYDLQGRHVKLLLRERVKPGSNRFTFSAAPLAAGTYILKITAGNRVVASKQVVKQ